MKKLMLSLFALATFCFSAATFANADTTSLDVSKYWKMDDQKLEVSMDDLPQLIKDSWAASKYKADKVEKIYKVTSENDKYFEFVVQTEAGKKTVKMDLEGKITSEKATS